MIIKANTNAENPTTQAVMFHLGTYIPQGVPDTFGFKRENLDVTTLTDNNDADDMVRIEPQRLGAGSAPGPTAPDLLDLVRNRVSSNPPRISELAHAASTPPTSPPTPAAAPSSNPDSRLN